MAMFGIKNRDLLELAEKAMRDGWSIDKTSGDRLKWVVPGGGACVFTSINITHPRAVKNIRSEMRYAISKAGVRPPPAPSIALPKPLPLKAALGESIRLPVIPPKEIPVMQAALPIVPSELIANTPRKDVPPPAAAKKEKTIIHSMEAIELVKQEIDTRGTWPPKAADMVFDEFRVRTHKSRNNTDGAERFYETSNSLLGALTKKYPKYLLRNMKQGPMKVLQVRDADIVPRAEVRREITIPEAHEFIKAPIPEAVLKVDSTTDLATQVKYLMATPGVSDEKKQALLRILLGA